MTTKTVTKAKNKLEQNTEDDGTVTTSSIDHKDMCNELISLSKGLIAEIDNLMSSNLSAPQTGKVLGDIMSSYSDQIDETNIRLHL
tara:strand:- start:4996 stop:5253 length:258 start_codon:yes stop_codon:yes gene_type:complete